MKFKKKTHHMNNFDKVVKSLIVTIDEHGDVIIDGRLINAHELDKYILSITIAIGDPFNIK